MDACGIAAVPADNVAARGAADAFRLLPAGSVGTDVAVPMLEKVRLSVALSTQTAVKTESLGSAGVNVRSRSTSARGTLAPMAKPARSVGAPKSTEMASFTE